MNIRGLAHWIGFGNATFWGRLSGLPAWETRNGQGFQAAFDSAPFPGMAKQLAWLGGCQFLFRLLLRRHGTARRGFLWGRAMPPPKTIMIYCWNNNKRPVSCNTNRRGKRPDIVDKNDMMQVWLKLFGARTEEDALAAERLEAREMAQASLVSSDARQKGPSPLSSGRCPRANSNQFRLVETARE